MCQTCKLCGRADKFDFNVPDDVWHAVAPSVFRDSVLCLACFDYLAAAKGINYVVETLYFAGDKASFTFVLKPA